VIEATERQALLASAVWLSTFPSADPGNPAPPQVVAPADLQRYRPADVGGQRGSEGRHPSFAFWQVTSPFVPWDEIVHAWLQAQGDPLKLKAFWQQWLGEPWEVQGEAPEVERLLERRQKWPRGRVPAGVLFLTGAVDVQGDRLEWAVYGWDRGLGQYLVDAGVIAGNPESAEPWLVLDGLLARTFTDAWGKPVGVEAWGVDSGYLSQQVYRFVARHASTQRVRALDGRHGWRLPAMGTPRTVSIDWQGRKVGSTQLWPVGTFDLKSEVYWALEQTVKGPDAAGQWPKGAFYFGDWADRTALEQLTAEYVADRETGGRIVKEWRKIKGRANEQLDLAVYARALARLLADPLSEADWDNLKAQRLGSQADVQLDFAQIWAPGLAAGSAGPVAAPSPASGPALPAVQRARGVRSSGVAI
jgi:phage terminase large subunit GpA-like protein